MKTLLKYGILAILLSCHLQVSAQSPIFGKGIYMRFGIGSASFYHADKSEPLVAPLYALPRLNVSTSFEIQASLGKRVALLFQFGSVRVRSKVRDIWTTAVHEAFPNTYITTDFPLLFPDQEYSRYPLRGMLGGAYLMEYQRWSVQLRALVGGFSSFPNTAYAVIKQPDSNALSTLSISLQADNYDADQGVAAFVGSLGLLTHRTIWRRWGVYGKVEWTAFRSPFTFDYVLENQVDGSRTTRSYGDTYPRMIHELEAHVGISFQLARFKK
ncbi:MAG: hypothetical protein JNM22_15140 [Saprospiraceae bacterium]|nr:hypothetical protein [Saprospiraceae bacterium]